MVFSIYRPVYSTVNSHLTLQESEFDSYDIYYAPVTLGIHLRELNVCPIFLPCQLTPPSDHISYVFLISTLDPTNALFRLPWR